MGDRIIAVLSLVASMLGVAVGWGLSQKAFLDFLWPAGTVAMLALWLATACIVIWRMRGDDRGKRAGAARGDAASGLVARFKAQRKAGAELAQEATTLEPIGNMPLVDDLVRRYNRFEEAVADLLVEADMLDLSWRRRWLEGPDWHNSDVYPVSREDLDRLGQMIGERVRWLEGIVAILEGAQTREQTLGRLIRRGDEIVSEAGLAGEGATESETERFLRRERDWIAEVERALRDEPETLSRFNGASYIPATGAFAIHNRTKARLDTLRRAVANTSLEERP